MIKSNKKRIYILLIAMLTMFAISACAAEEEASEEAETQQESSEQVEVAQEETTESQETEETEASGETSEYLALIEEVAARPGVTVFAASVSALDFKDDVYTTQLTLYEEDETKTDTSERFTFLPESREGYTLTTEQAEDVIILVDATNGYKQIAMEEYYANLAKNGYYNIFRYYMQDGELVMMAEVNFMNP